MIVLKRVETSRDVPGEVRAIDVYFASSSQSTEIEKQLSDDLAPGTLNSILEQAQLKEAISFHLDGLREEGLYQFPELTLHIPAYSAKASRCVGGVSPLVRGASP